MTFGGSGAKSRTKSHRQSTARFRDALYVAATTSERFAFDKSARADERRLVRYELAFFCAIFVIDLKHDD